MSTADGPPTYRDYYWRTIAAQLGAGPLRGLKLVVGPTGLGKTFGIPEALTQLRTTRPDQRCAYVTHRHVLLDEMEKLLERRQIPVVYLKRNAESVATLCTRTDDLPALVDDLRRLGLLQGSGLSRAEVLALLEDIRMLSGITSRSLRSSRRNPVREQRDALARQVLWGVEASLRQADERAREHLLSQPLVWDLFPYVAFLYDPRRPVLLTTTQKLLHGFFDGTARRRITALEDTVLFLDEFEIQEPVMLKILAAAEGVRDPIEFVRLFCDEMEAQRRQGWLDPQPDDSEARAEARQSAVRLLTWLRDHAAAHGYPSFPHPGRFVLDPNHRASSEGITIFQSSTIVQTTPFSVTVEPDAWRIVDEERDAPTSSSYQLLDLAARATTRILDFFAFLWEQRLEAEWDAWVAQCYNRRNDHHLGAYHTAINIHGQLRRPPRAIRAAGRVAGEETLYDLGMRLSRIERGTYAATAPNEAQVSQRTLLVTPESILAQLAQQNLVFAISATGDIPRLVNAFDLDWLKEHTPYLPPDEADRDLIARLRDAKAAQRDYRVRFSIASALDAEHRLNRYLDELERRRSFTRDDDAGEGTQTLRRVVVSRFLETARWVAHESQGVAHLVFVVSFRFIRVLLEDKLQRHLQQRDDLTQHLEVTRRADGEENTYQLRIDGRPCAVVLLDAEIAKKRGTRSFEVHPDEGPLIVVTQYETASLGVNLEWTGHPDHPQAAFDFEGIHLLEGKHFYISKDEGDADAGTIFVWKLAKLAERRQIDYRTWLRFLQKWDISAFNAQPYKRTKDYLLNQVALFHQAFGRVDRKPYTRVQTEVRIADSGATLGGGDSVLDLLERYVQHTGGIGQQREEREAWTSPLILQIHAEVARVRRSRIITNQRFRQDIGPAQDRSRSQIDVWVQALNTLRQDTYRAEQAAAVRTGWLQMREAMLRHDYHFIFSDPQLPIVGMGIDFCQDFVLSTSMIHAPGMLLRDRSGRTIFRDASADTYPYDLNGPYAGLAQHEAIATFFHERGYPLGYHATVPGMCFTPRAIQAILTGAIGEAALEALLRMHRIHLDDPSSHPDALFELFDAKVRDLPLYLDAKHYGLTTVERMDAVVGDADYNADFNGVQQLQKWQRKWQRIVEETGERASKLVIINLQSDAGRANQFWDQHGQEVASYHACAVALIQGALDREVPGKERPPFLAWVGWVQDALTAQRRREG